MKEKFKEKINIQSIKIILFFLYLFFVYIWGAHSDTVKYSEIILIIFWILEGISIIKNREIKISIPIILLFSFSVYCLISSLWAINSELAIEKSITLFSLSIFALMAYNFFVRIENGHEKLLEIIMWVGIFFSIYVILYYGIDKYFTKLISGKRMGAEIDNVNIIGIETSLTFIIAIFFGLNNNKKCYLILSILPLIVGLGTGSKKSIIAIFLGIIFVFISKIGYKNLNFKQILKLSLILIVTIILLINLPIFSRLFARIQEMFYDFSNSNNVYTSGYLSSTKLRILYIKRGIQQFIETPILGIGIGNCGYITEKISERHTYLHNNFVELLAATGIIGFAIYYSIYVYIIIKLIKLRKKNKYVNITLILFIVNLILDVATVSYYAKNTYVYFLLGILTIKNLEDKKETKC